LKKNNDKTLLDDLSGLLTFKEPPANLTPSTEKPQYPEMEFSRMKPFPNHMFNLYTGQRLDDMIESIKLCGIIEAIVLWKKAENVYIILSGHNRVNAGKLAGLTKGPVFIREDLTEEEAMLFVTETNLRQRGFAEMTHYERAHCLYNHYEAMKCQGKRRDLVKEIEELIKPHDNSLQGTSAEVQHLSKSRDKVALEYGLSRDKVAKYIRLATLYSYLLSCVDTGEISFLAAYDISFIEDMEKQEFIASIIKRDNCKVDMKMAALLRKYYQNKTLTNEVIEQILSGEKTRKPKSDKPQAHKIKANVVKRFFTKGQTAAEPRFGKMEQAACR